MTYDQAIKLLERTIPSLEHQANCCGGLCKRAIEAKAILEEIRWG